MHVDILNGNYIDPLDRDYYSDLGIEDYENNVQDLCDKDLKENYNKYFKKKRNALEELDETEDEDDPTMGGKYDARRHMRKVNIGTEPWNYDQSFIWPDYEAEAFENSLEQFRQRPESNTGYLNKKLNQIMQTRWGKEQANKCIDNTLFKNRLKESAKKRFQRQLREATLERVENFLFKGLKSAVEIGLRYNKKDWEGIIRNITQVMGSNEGIEGDKTAKSLNKAINAVINRASDLGIKPKEAQRFFERNKEVLGKDLGDAIDIGLKASNIQKSSEEDAKFGIDTRKNFSQAVQIAKNQK